MGDPPTGWVVTGHHSDVLNYVAPQDIGQSRPSDITIGLFGRGNRDTDARSLKHIHVEDNRTQD
jgi:hypothetical protein